MTPQSNNQTHNGWVVDLYDTLTRNGLADYQYTSRMLTDDDPRYDQLSTQITDSFTNSESYEDLKTRIEYLEDQLEKVLFLLGD